MASTKKAKADNDKYVIVYDCCSDPAEVVVGLEKTRNFVLGLVTGGENNTCCEGQPISSSQVQVFKVSAVGKVDVKLTF